MGKQVEADHYRFVQYMSLERWSSLWYQVAEIAKLKPRSILEVGPGPGLFKSVARSAGLTVETLDIDPDLNPDHVASATALPFAAGAYDVVCAFQVLEHVPYQTALASFAEFTRVAQRGVVISLPDAAPFYRLHLQIPGIGAHSWIIPNCFRRHQEHSFDGEHYWEINKKRWPLEKILNDFGAIAKLERTYRPFENPSHRFFVFSKVGKNT